MNFQTRASITPLFLVALSIGLTPACTAIPQDGPQLSGYTCCNFHYEVDRISDANWSSLPMLHAGTRIRTVNYFGYRIEVLVGPVGYERKKFLSLDYGQQQSPGEWARRMIVA